VSGNPKGRPPGSRNKPKDASKDLREVMTHLAALEAFTGILARDLAEREGLPEAQPLTRPEVAEAVAAFRVNREGRG
jgi:hypothetical protein